MSAKLLQLCLPFQKVIKSNYLWEEARLRGPANENQTQTAADLRKPRSSIKDRERGRERETFFFHYLQTLFTFKYFAFSFAHFYPFVYFYLFPFLDLLKLGWGLQGQAEEAISVWEWGKNKGAQTGALAQTSLGSGVPFQQGWRVVVRTGLGLNLLSAAFGPNCRSLVSPVKCIWIL